ncbi:MAG: cytochrome c biogenesis protein ResB [Desulfitobacteriaceae bacterium]|nr:cytochrome c biogenesis protein ResB [Desulfitobacteriaceae bacterium]MDI6877827.1 cytochrome c biogenesis protein ResB [Desulfitobacteriaceae bacterium]MDI6912772.1 cytochrome c biogenesis protein ResB [Desulfitobacteriaceae bacterium]
MGRIWQQIYRAFFSIRMALWFMVILGLVMVWGIVFSRTVFAGAWLIVPALMLLLNMMVCTGRQFLRARKFSKRRSTLNKSSHLRAADRPEIAFAVDTDGSTPERISLLCTNTLRRRGYRVIIPNDDSFNPAVESEPLFLYARRGWLGYWGSPLFHTALMIIIMGGLLSGYARTVEPIVLTEGGSTELQPGFLSFTPEKVTLHRVRLDYSPDGKLQEWTAEVGLEQGGKEVNQTVNSQKAFVEGSLSMAIQANGYTPGLIIREGGRELARVRIRLNSIPTDRGFRNEDDVTLPGNDRGALRLQMAFWPNFIWKGQEADTKGDAPQNPALSLSEAGQPPYKIQVLKPGESARFGDRSITFDHVKPWLMFKVTRDPGYFVILAGFWLGISGLLLLFLSIPQEVLVTIVIQGQEARLSIKGRSQHFKNSFQIHLSALTRELKQVLNVEEQEEELKLGH